MAGMIHSKHAELDFKGSYDLIFNSCIEAAQSTGKIQNQDKSQGFIFLKSGFTLKRNPTSLRVTVTKNDHEACYVAFDARSFDGYCDTGACGNFLEKYTNKLFDIL